MADRGKPTSQLPVWANTVSGNDSIVLLTRSQSIPNTYIVNLSVTFNNANFSINLANSQSISANTVIVRGTTTPANSGAVSFTPGTIFWDANNIYVAVSNTVVKRASLSTF
jgi:hypothetical protein